MKLPFKNFDQDPYLKLLIMKGLLQLSIYKHRQKSRKALLKLTDEMLKDIGVSRFQAEEEGNKPFWKGDSSVFDTIEYPRLTLYLTSNKVLSKPLTSRGVSF